MARVRFAEIVAVAALAGSLAACGSSSAKSAAAPAGGTSTNQAASPSSAATTPVSGASSTPAANTVTTTVTASLLPSTQPTTKGSSTASAGGGVANAGDHVAIVGTLQYLAPGKFIVHPDDGSTDQGFYVSDATQILGAAAICGGPDGRVTIGGDDYGTTKCTEDQLETAAKTNSVKVRVTMDKSGSVETVEERYHP